MLATPKKTAFNDHRPSVKAQSPLRGAKAVGQT
jgi:hypothetical protein